MLKFEIHLLNWDIPSERRKELMEWMYGSVRAKYNSDDYRYAYSREIDTATMDPSFVWQEFSVPGQKAYPDRSMTTGDVIRICDGDTVIKTYLVSPFGFDLI